jgi:hypothetical protein
MGAFDWVRCEYPLPDGAPQDGYQTKDTDKQWLELYEIRTDGTLWTKDVERRWRSEPERVLGGYFETVSECWRLVKFTGEVRFYDDKWDFSAYFVDGVLRHLETIESPTTDRPSP